MKYTYILAFFCLCLFTACNNSPERPEPMLDPNYEPGQPATSTPATFSNEASTGGSVYHYICPNNCGGGDAAGNCPVCGTAYTHNQAFHNQANAGTTTTPANPNITTSGSPTPANTPTPSPEPPQNASGVWHYTCSNGCTGGAGSATACATCGSTLVHNTLYHQ